MKDFTVKIFAVVICVLSSANITFSQNSYGWERIYNSIFGINGFYVNHNSAGSKSWMIRPVYNYLGSEYYDFIKYNHNSGSWYISSNSIFRGVYYSYYIGGGHSISGHELPHSFDVSRQDSNFILINTTVPHIGSPPNDKRLFYSYDNGASRTDVAYFQYRGFNSLVINPSKDSTCYGASRDTIYKSFDRGITWTALSHIYGFTGSLKINPNDTGIVYAIDDSLRISTNGGVSFQHFYPKRFSQILLYPGSRLIASSKNVVYGSSDYGFNWNAIDSLPDSVCVIDSDPDNPDVLYAGTIKGLYRSTNSGANFYLFNNSFSPSRKVIAICKEPSRNFVYIVTEEAVYKCWNSFVIGIEENTFLSPEDFILYQNFPNPFNPVTRIKYKLSESSSAEVTVFDIQGKKVAELVNREHHTGTYEVEFNAGSSSSGTYFYVLRIDGIIAGVKSMILLK